MTQTETTPESHPLRRVFVMMGGIAAIVTLLVAIGLVPSYLGVLEIGLVSVLFFIVARFV